MATTLAPPRSHTLPVQNITVLSPFFSERLCLRERVRSTIHHKPKQSSSSKLERAQEARGR